MKSTSRDSFLFIYLFFPDQLFIYLFTTKYK